uniref:Mitotic-spindle organizing protein 1 n=1 Tax=Bracon brevicornis TaxID=1563983 RepID=A0A6V7M0D7_9HYME
MPEPVYHQVNAARKTFKMLYEISEMLNTNLDPATLSICVRLCENGVNPQALATVIKELQREIKVMESPHIDNAKSNAK